MNTPRFLVAKYAPDVRRMEPRNFGLIVWNNGQIEHKFIEDVTAGLRRLHVVDLHAYRQWIVSWKLQCLKSQLRGKHGEPVLRQSPDFLDALRLRTSDNFMLFDGGRVTDCVDTIETKSLLSELFAELVGEEPTDDEKRQHTEADSLRIESAKVLKNSGIRERQGWRNNYDMTCPVGSTIQPFHFDHAIHTDRPLALIQKVPLLNHGVVYKTAFQFEKMREANRVKREDCAALVYLDKSQMNDMALESYKLLQNDSIVVNVADPENAAAQLRSLGLAM